MTDDNASSDNETSSREVWPRKLNRILISIGVLTFGLIIADRLVDMFQADDMPAVAESVNESDILPTSQTQPLASETSGDDIPVEVNGSGDEQLVTSGDEQVVMSDAERLVLSGDDDKESEEDLTIENVFGSRLVFVSTSEPLYVVTADERRIGIGEPINEETTLAGITSQRIILEKAGDLLPVQLPEPGVK